MRNLILVLISIFLVSGCSTSTEKWHIDTSERICSDYGGVHRIEHIPQIIETSIIAECVSGHKFSISRPKE